MFDAKWSAFVLNRQVAPGFTTFTRADIPDLRNEFPHSDHWITDHFLNSVLRAHFKEGMRQLVIGFLRRATGAFDAFHTSRRLTLDVVKAQGKRKQPITQYYAAVDAWENFVLQTQMALDLFRHITGGQGAFSKNDGSAHQRLYTIGNQIKHVASCVSPKHDTGLDALPVWLNNDGLQSYDVLLSYIDAAAVLSDVSRVAERLKDPKTAGQPSSDSVD